MNINNTVETIKQKRNNRSYGCPCGKKYLSYPALFTHIKQKHQGKAPGKITKPPTIYGKRGRPKIIDLKKNIKIKINNQTDETKYARSQILKPQIDEKKSAQLPLYWICRILDNIKQTQTIPTKIWSQISILSLMNTYMLQFRFIKPINFIYFGVPIGYGFTQFLLLMSQKLSLLFMLYLQYVVDQNNSTDIINIAPIQFLIEYSNNFINQYIPILIQQLEINNLSIMNKNNIESILCWFFKWLQSKQYSMYIVKLKNDIHF